MKKQGHTVNINKKIVLMMLLTSSLSLGSGNAFAAEEESSTYTLDEVIVTATRTMKGAKAIPASVDVITAEEIAAKNVTSITEALQMKTGVYMSPVAQGGISIRGFSSTDILVLLDGQPMNSSWNGLVNWEMVPVERVARIEIVRGATSSLYGGRAVGAVVNIITKDSKKDQSIDTVVSYGSNDTWKKSVYFDQKINDKLSVGVGYEKRSSDGYRGFYRTVVGTNTTIVNPSTIKNVNLQKMSDGSYLVGGRGEKKWENQNNSFHFKYKFDDNKSLKYTYMKSENDYSYTNPFSYAYDANGNQIFNGTVKTQDGKYVKLAAGAFWGYVGKRETDLHTVNYQDTDHKVQVNIGFSDTKKDGYSSAPSTVTDIHWTGNGGNSFYPSKSYNLDFQKTWENIGKHTLVAGFNVKEESFDQTRYNLSNWKDHNSVTSFSEKHGGKAQNFALFLQDEYKLSDPVTMYLGARYDHYKKYDGYSKFYDAGEVLNQSKSKNHNTGSYNELSPKIALQYKVDQNTSYYTSYGHSFNPPLLYQVYRYGGGGMGDVIANPDLEPETSDTFEIGMKKSLDEKTKLGISLYHVKTDNKVAYLSHYITGTSNVDYKKYENAGTEKRRGVEIDLTHKLNENWSGYINYAWQNGKIINVTGKESNNFDIPKHLLHTGIEYNKDKFNAILDAQYVSERQAPDSTTGEYGSEDAFFVMNTYFNYKVTPNATLQFKIQNLFNKEFYASEATSGRSYGVSLRYQF